ncbi:MAG TPA: amidohydrolase family protein, partial [Longimicrobiales bacterium]|nr:amidohydrolase family protein [Longimicrobiales bacterium]
STTQRTPVHPDPDDAMNARSLTRSLLLVVALLIAAVGDTAAQQQPYDLVIRNGRVMDGTGNPWFAADVGIRDGRIVTVGRLGDVVANRTIDAAGRYVVPGFIDIHSHADDTGNPDRYIRSEDARRRSAPNLVAQGITTVVVNQDGRSLWPIADQRALVERLGVGPNVMLMVGHGEVRRQVMGSDVQRPATPAEVQRMRALVRQALEEGAVGLSAGLEYVPGRYSTTDEVVALAEELVPFDGVYISHQRSEGSDPMWYWPSQDGAGPPTLLDAIRETIEIGERSGARVVASHIKAKGAHYWGSGMAAIQLIEAARERGVRIYADQYPYETSGTDGNTVLIPAWATAGSQSDGTFADRLRTVLADEARAADLRGDITHEIMRRGGAERVVIFEHPDAAYVGQTLAWVAERHGLDPVDAAIHIQLNGDVNRRGGARIRGFSLSDLDANLYAARPWVATATDGGIALPSDGANVHARFYGSFPRKIRHFALDHGIIALEDAIRSSTSLPAQIMGLKDRGVIREGAVADLVIFDIDRIRDMATFENPHQYPEGIDYVFVNGRAVVDGGRLTGELAGRVLAR